MMMIGRHNGRIAGLKDVQNMDPVIFSLRSGRYPRFLEIFDTMNIMVAQRRIPGPKPAINNLPMDTFAIHP